MLEKLENIDKQSELRKKAMYEMIELGYCPYKATGIAYLQGA